MTESLQQLYRQNLPEELKELLEPHLNDLRDGRFYNILQDGSVRDVLNFNLEARSPAGLDWYQILGQRIAEACQAENEESIRSSLIVHRLFLAAIASLQAFLQSNVTGPILPFSSAKCIFAGSIATYSRAVRDLRQELVRSLAVDGEGAYSLAPNIELFCFARAVVMCPAVQYEDRILPWIRLRINFVHQRLLSDLAPSLQQAIFADIKLVDQLLQQAAPTHGEELLASFTLEKAAIKLHHNQDKEARADLASAARARGFVYAITGRLGKKTKYQRRDISQLVVLATSEKVTGNPVDSLRGSTDKHQSNGNGSIAKQQPEALDLNDDTLLEKIAFAEPQTKESTIPDDSPLPEILANLDPSAQPRLEPLESIILLDEASSITNTNPADGITREETKPYATRVIEGGSSNWQVYTQALLLRSRIEGYSSRTVERGLMQLQAVVDQVVADTVSVHTQDIGADAGSEKAATSFLPKSKEDETAPVSERLLYIYPLCSPFRWDLEAELASRWVSLGGLRSALDIYERLEMWPEAALCLASTDREGKAKRIIRRQLCHSSKGKEFDKDADQDAEEWTGDERVPPPSDAPRLYCILGDIDDDISMYEKAWTISGERYSRAQRSLGRHYWTKRDASKASLAYQRSLKVKPIDHGSWFAYGCCLLELSEYRTAVEAFSRSVQMDDTDAESWSNLATALLRLPPDEDLNGHGLEGDAAHVVPRLQSMELDDEEGVTTEQSHQDPQRHIRDALQALRQASKHSPTKYRIVSNLLTVAATLDPPSWNDIIAAQSRLIDLRGKTEGESCVDAPIFNALVDHIITTPTQGSTDAQVGGDASATHTTGNGGFYDPSRPGLARMVVKLADEKIMPLITASAPLWQIIGRLYRYRNKPASALSTEEKAWRIVTQKPGWDVSNDTDAWSAVVDATLSLVAAYEDLGPKQTTEGLAAGSGELVAKDWKFKARSAVRSVKGKGKANWEGSEGWERLEEALEQLKG